MKKRIVSGLIVSTILVGSLFASNGEKSNCMMKKNESHKMVEHKSKNHILGMFRNLNLTDEQEKKIQDIIIESRKNMKIQNEAFTKDSFDKNKYIQIMSEKRDNMIKSQADVIEKAYSILTVQQKEQLKVLMDSKKEKMEQRMNEKIKG